MRCVRNKVFSEEKKMSSTNNTDGIMQITVMTTRGQSLQIYFIQTGIFLKELSLPLGGWGERLLLRVYPGQNSKIILISQSCNRSKFLVPGMKVCTKLLDYHKHFCFSIKLFLKHLMCTLKAKLLGPSSMIYKIHLICQLESVR